MTPGRHIRLDDRTTWDRAAWNRYVGMATRLEPEFMPELLRLIRDIERLERLATLPRAIPRRPQRQRLHGRTGEMETMCGSARLRTVACPLGSMRGLNRSPSRSPIPASPSRRARAPVMTGEAPSARAASVSLRSRAVRSARGPDGPDDRFPCDRTRGNDAGMGAGARPEGGTTEGMKRCPDSSTACN